MGNITIKELREAFKDSTKKEINRFSIVSYHQGYASALHCVKKGLSVLVGKEIEPPLKIEDIVALIDRWYNDAEKELEEIKKKHNWEE